VAQALCAWANVCAGLPVKRILACCPREEREELEDLDGASGELCELAELLTRAALLADGYRQHHRGEWRKPRERTKLTD
jgi:hypothetical protein